MLRIYQSNRTECLADALANVVAQPLSSPFIAETIISQNYGMARWLTLQLAQRHGVCANLRFELPGEFIWRIITALIPDVPSQSLFDISILTWRIMQCLNQRRGDISFAPINAYLHDGSDVRRYELAQRIAQAYDQYLVYRPDWILHWESNHESHWQAVLWRELVESAPQTTHWVALQQKMINALQVVSHAEKFIPETSLSNPAISKTLILKNPINSLPERVSIFGIPTLSPGYLQVIEALAQTIDIHLFILNPCQEYWGDIVSDHEKIRQEQTTSMDELYLEVGHPLLASLGKVGRDLIELLQDSSGLDMPSMFIDPGTTTLLNALQHDMLFLQQHGAEALPAIPIDSQDRSVQVHVCHGPMREVEVLHDQLLAILSVDTSLAPTNIIVMMPDINAYAPYIEAVFGTAPKDRDIAYSIADRDARDTSALLASFLTLLHFPRSRYTANQVLDLLTIPALQRQFSMTDDELPVVRRWVNESGIRWGINATSRQKLDLPATHEHTWQAGLDRLLLGYAMPGQDRHLWKNILPFDTIEGQQTQLLGRFLNYTSKIFSLEQRLAGHHPVTHWVEILTGVLNDFYLPEDNEVNELQILRQTLVNLSEQVGYADFDQPVSLDVIILHLEQVLSKTPTASGFMGSGVSFCEFQPMRSIPFAVVCLIGMNDGRFPRLDRPSGINLISKDNRRRGDRSIRGEDRYVFLEALLSARQYFYLSYTGQNIRDNSVIPPSVVVNQLLDVIASGFTMAGSDRDIIDSIVVRHPLHAYSPRYFRQASDLGTNQDAALFSYSQEFCEASRYVGKPQSIAPFMHHELPTPDVMWQTLSLEGLIRFYQNPTEYLLRQRLGIKLTQSETVADITEPFIGDALTGYQLRNKLLSIRMDVDNDVDTRALIRGYGMLPHGQVGDILFDQEHDSATLFAHQLAQVLPARYLTSPVVDIHLANIKLTGWLSGITAQGLFDYRFAKVTAADWLRFWIRHLVLNTLAIPQVTCQSQLLVRDGLLQLKPVQQPQRYLTALLEHYWQGMSQPLAFFPKTALAYCQALNKSPNETAAQNKAGQSWLGNDFLPGEYLNPYYQLVFSESAYLDPAFQTLATTLLQPLFEHLEN